MTSGLFLFLMKNHICCAFSEQLQPLNFVFEPIGIFWDKKPMGRRKYVEKFVPVSRFRSGNTTYIAFPQPFNLHQAQQHPEVLLWHYQGDIIIFFSIISQELSLFWSICRVSTVMCDKFIPVLVDSECKSGYG